MRIFKKTVKRKYLFIGVGALLLTTSIVTIFALNDPDSNVKISYLGQSGFLIQYNGKSVYIDPYLLPYGYDGAKADGILITHPHYDHLDLNAISKIHKNNTEYIIPESIEFQRAESNITSVEPYFEGIVAGFNYTTLPMYNLGNHSSNIHLRSQNWCTYIITVNGFNILHVGDSDNVPELNNLNMHIDLALLPIATAFQNMGSFEAAKLIGSLKPDKMVPMHYWSMDPEIFKDLYQESYPETEILPMLKDDSFYLK